MLFRTFTGGIHPKEEKELTEDKPIVRAKIPAKVTIPLLQHTGAPCEPLVKVGDEVELGQRIGDSEKFISSSVHASVSGKVVRIEDSPHPCGLPVKAIVIESDGKDTPHESIKPFADIEKLSKDEIRKIVRSSGIVGLGGGAFPTHVKLDPPTGKKIEYYILNGAECEPYLTGDTRIMIEYAKDVVHGLKAMMKATDAQEGIIAVEDNKPEAIKILRGEGRGVRDEGKSINIEVLKTKYPQGGEKQLIKVLTGREIPSGGLPMDAEVAISNVGTAAAVAKAIRTGMPLIERVVTVTGKSVKNPSNLLVRIGTSFIDIIEECGGLPSDTTKVVAGGPMMGIAQSNLDAPVVKGVTGLLLLSKDETGESEPCIRCAKCVDACPARILPVFIGLYSEAKKYDLCKDYRAYDCIECGICSYVCPSKINLAQLIKLAKLELAKRK